MEVPESNQTFSLRWGFNRWLFQFNDILNVLLKKNIKWLVVDGLSAAQQLINNNKPA